MACSYNCSNGKVFLEAVGMVDCPECRDIVSVLTKQTDTGDTVYDRLRVPEAYKFLGTSDKELFSAQAIASFSSASISEVTNIMTKINKDIYNGVVTSISPYIHASNLVDVKRFVYGAQTLALDKGLGVVPLVSLNTMYGIQLAGDYPSRNLQEYEDKRASLDDVEPDTLYAIDGYRTIQETKLTYYDFVSTDVCFVEATANTSAKGWTALADLLQERAKKNLPTFVIGYWASKTSNSSGLRYLLAQEGVFKRLDLLVPFEVKSKRSTDSASVSRNIEIGTTKSEVSAGLSLNSLMGG